MAATSEQERNWALANQRANLFLLDSASFYLSGRRLLLSNFHGTVMPGLVCGAYAIEQVIKAALEYKGITTPTGRKGHDLVLLAGLLPKQWATANNPDLQLFTSYFDSRYFDNKTRASSLTNADYQKLDDLYYAFYKDLDIPIQYHCKVGLLASGLNDRPHSQADREILQLHNAHFDDYVDPKRRSSESR